MQILQKNQICRIQLLKSPNPPIPLSQKSEWQWGTAHFWDAQRHSLIGDDHPQWWYWRCVWHLCTPPRLNQPLCEGHSHTAWVVNGCEGWSQAGPWQESQYFSDYRDVPNLQCNILNCNVLILSQYKCNYAFKRQSWAISISMAMTPKPSSNIQEPTQW